ncbi:CopG family antitoxin [Kutzneria chonburiensis]|uniref:CopG family antitoxin n=1 Tax=Kutzneria chonburiensis TaxID=1483604 RepID=A0ABV6N1H0_9PSEU|nr:CopG family antitoxin [Kutzneria chonburiensis]
MTKREELPRSAEELAELADYYDNNDTSGEMDAGEWVDPRPMVTTSLRLPDAMVAALKEEARRRGIRYTALVREVLESHLAAPRPVVDVFHIEARLDHLTVLVERLAEHVTHAEPQHEVGAREPQRSAG